MSWINADLIAGIIVTAIFGSLLYLCISGKIKNKLIRIRIMAGVGLCLLVILGWTSVNLYAHFSKSAASAFIDEFHERYNEKDYRYIYGNLSDPSFILKTKYQEFTKKLDSRFNAVGKVESFKIISIKPHYDTRGFYVMVRCLCKSEKGQVKEQFVLKKDKKSWVLDRYYYYGIVKSDS